MGETVTFGIIGAGGIASKLHMPQLARIPEARVKWVHGRKEHRLRALSEKYGVPRITHDYADILSDPEVEAVVVATPHALHVRPGIDALEAGKHLLMQKPLCGDLEEADDFVAAVERSDRICLALPHFSPAVYAARRELAAGRIGKPSGIYCRSSHGGPEVYYAEVRDNFAEKDDDLWFFDAKRAAVGALFDMGVYAVSSVVAVMGSAVSVTGRTATVDKPTELEDTATLLLELEGGVLGTAETGWCDPARTWRMSVHGTRGKLTAPGEDGKPLTFWEPGSYTREDAPPVPHDVDTASEERGNAHEYFLRCVAEGRQPEVSSAYTARHVTEILLAGLESARTGRTVPVRSRVKHTLRPRRAES